MQILKLFLFAVFTLSLFASCSSEIPLEDTNSSYSSKSRSLSTSNNETIEKKSYIPLNSILIDDVAIILSTDSSHYIVTGVKENIAIINIPSEYNSIPITEIKDLKSTTLYSLVISSSVSTIYYSAIQNCPALTNLFYEGSQSDFENIKIIDDTLPSPSIAAIDEINDTNDIQSSLDNDSSSDNDSIDNTDDTNNIVDNDDTENSDTSKSSENSDNTAIIIEDNSQNTTSKTVAQCFENISIVYNTTYPYANNDFYFALTSDKAALTLREYTGSSKEIEIPAYFSTLPVIAIESTAFVNSDYKITSIKIPATVNKIEDNTFSSFTALKEAFYFGDSLFIGSANKPLTSILWYNTIETNTLLLGKRNSADKFTLIKYKGSESDLDLRTITTIYNIDTLASDSFSDNQNLKTLLIPSEIMSIKQNAFAACDSIYRVWIEGKNITIETSGNESITKYMEVVSSFAELKTDEKGFVCDGKTLLAYKGSEKNITLPSSINRVAKSAFYGNKTIESVSINSNIAQITFSPYAFYESSIKNIIFPKYLRAIEIDKYAFAECKNLISAKMGSTEKKNVFFIPSTLLKLGEGAFSGDSMLQAVYFESVGWPAPLNTLSELPSKCFANCVSLERVYLGSQISILNDYVFYGCDKLAEIKNLSALSFKDNTNAGIRAKLK